MKTVVQFVVLCLFISACQDVKRPEKPDNLIPETTMVELLSEIYLANAARSVNNRHIREQGIKLDSFLFKKYKVDSLQFAKSNSYYAADLDRYNSIFERVNQRLEKLKVEENRDKLEEDTLKATEKTRRDSTELYEEEMDTTKTEGILETTVSTDSID